MVNYQDATLDAAFAALADPTRRAMIARLARGSASAGELARPFAMSLPAISKHLKVLEGAGLIARRREGRVHRMTLRGERLAIATSWIDEQRQFWEQSLDRLARHLDETPTEADHGNEERDQTEDE